LTDDQRKMATPIRKRKREIQDLLDTSFTVEGCGLGGKTKRRRKTAHAPLSKVSPHRKIFVCEVVFTTGNNHAWLIS